MTTPPTGVIHDIGYAHYDGPRLGRGATVRALFVDSAKGAYGFGRTGRAKVMPLLLLAVICIPALMVVVIAAVTDADRLPVTGTSYLLNLQPVIAIYVAGQAPASVSRDLRFRVVSLYFSRPLRRSDYVLAKLGALTTAVLVLLAAPLTVLFVGALLCDIPVGDVLPGYLTALAGAALLAPLLAGIGLVIAATTPRRGLGVAAIVAVLLVLAAVQAAIMGIVGTESGERAASWSGLLSPFTLAHGVQTGLLAADSEVPPEPTVVGGLVFLAVAVALVLACVGALLARYRRVSVT